MSQGTPSCSAARAVQPHWYDALSSHTPEISSAAEIWAISARYGECDRRNARCDSQSSAGTSGRAATGKKLRHESRNARARAALSRA